MNFDAIAFSSCPAPRPLALLDFAAAAVDMMTNVRAARASLRDEAGVARADDALARLTAAARALEDESASAADGADASTLYLLGCAHELFTQVNPWRLSVFHGADWVAHFETRWRGALPAENAAMQSVIDLLAPFADAPADRANLLRHVVNVTEQAALCFVRREEPTSRKAQAKAQAKAKAQRQKKVADAVHSQEHARILSQAAANTRQLFSNPAIVSRLKETTADLIRASVPDADLSADSGIIDQVFQMSMNSAPAVVEGMAAQLGDSDLLNGGAAAAAAGLNKKKLKKIARAAAKSVQQN